MAIERKYNSLIENSTWKLVSPPNRANVIIGKWCFRLKKDWFRYILKYKAWWVAHGYKQEEEIDYIESFAAVIKPMSNKCLFAIGVKYDYWIQHMIIITAFL